MLLDIEIGDKMELDSAISKKVEDVFKSELEDEKFELNYVIVDDSVTFFFPISEGKELSDDAVEKISSILDSSFEGVNLVNQEYRYSFNMNPCQ